MPAQLLESASDFAAGGPAAPLRDVIASSAGEEGTVLADPGATIIAPPRRGPASGGESRVGHRLAGYEIRGVLGQGGMGTVYRAFDARLERELALKTVRTELLGEEGKQRFLREAKACSRLNHPNIVTVYSAGEEAGDPWMAMELVEGRSLQQQLDRGDIPVRRRMGWALQLLDALAALHAAGIVHRDLKPDNAMVTPDGTVKLMDFGLAHLADASALTRAGQVMGTVSYMAPEQVLGRPTDARSDVFAMGVLLHQLVRGELPFTGEHPMSVMYAIQHHEPPEPDLDAAELPAELAPVLRRALAKDPAGRFADAGALRDALREALGEEAAASGGRARRGTVVAAGVALVALAALAWALLSGPGELPRDRERAVHLNESGFDAMVEGEFADARRDLRAAILADDSYAQPWNNLGVIALAAEDYAEADSLFARALGLDATYAEAWLNRADAADLAGSPGLAERYYREALAADPQLSAAHNNLGSLLLAQGRTGDARGHLEAGLAVAAGDDPVRFFLLRNLGKLELATGDPAAAAAALDRALALVPDDAQALELRAQATGAP